MKLKLPEYLLCEDPTSAEENLFIYYAPSGSLVHVVHTDALSETEVRNIRLTRSRYVEYSYKNSVGQTAKILFVAEVIGRDDGSTHAILEKCAHWYACYLGWEHDCDEVMKSA